MSSAHAALQTAIFSALAADPALAAIAGPPRIYDDVPQDAAFPYLSFGASIDRDWSTSTEPGEEHLFTLHVWSRARGRREVFAILAALRAALHDRALALTGFRLVNLREEFAEARPDPDSDTYHGVLRLRAVTEPA